MVSFDLSALVLACQTLLGVFIVALFVVKAALVGIEALRRV